MRYYHTETDKQRENDFVNATGTLRMTGYANTTRILQTGRPDDTHDKDFSRTLHGTAPRYYQEPAAVKARPERLELTYNTRPHCGPEAGALKYVDVRTSTIPRGPELATTARAADIARREQAQASSAVKQPGARVPGKRHQYDFNSLSQKVGAGDYAIQQTTCIQAPVIPTKNPKTCYWTPCGDVFEG